MITHEEDPRRTDRESPTRARSSRTSRASASRTAPGASPSARTPRSPKGSSSSEPRTGAAGAPDGHSRAAVRDAPRTREATRGKTTTYASYTAPSYPRGRRARTLNTTRGSWTGYAPRRGVHGASTLKGTRSSR